VFDGHLIIRNTTVSDIDGDARLGNLSVLQGSRLKHPFTTIDNVYYLSLQVVGKVVVDATSYIEAEGCGYLGGRRDGNNTNYGYTLGNTTEGGSDYGSGGGYSGLGGQNQTYAVNPAYGSLYEPRHPGSGGGAVYSTGPAGSGGGVIIIEAEELQIDGTISSDGYDTTNAGAGAGGSILLKTNTLTGSGAITANGGNSTQFSGGGGGRIAVYYENASAFDLSKITAYGGLYTNGISSTRNGGAGTVFLKQPTTTPGDLIVNNNSISSRQDSTPLPAVGQGFNTLLEANRTVNSAASFTPGSLIGIKLNPQPTGNTVFTIINNNGTEIFTDPADGDMTQTAGTGSAYIGEHLLFNLTVKGNAQLFTLDRIKVSGTLTVAPGSTLKAENHQ